MGGRGGRSSRDARDAARLAAPPSSPTARGMLRCGRCLAACPSAADAGTTMRSRAIAELAAALARHRGAPAWRPTAQGRAFLATTRAAWPCTGARPRCAAHGAARSPIRSPSASLPPAMASRSSRRLPRFLQPLAANLVSAGMRLIPLGQTDGQRIIAALEPVIAAARGARSPRRSTRSAAASFRADWRSMRHETQYTRLFRIDDAADAHHTARCASASAARSAPARRR